MFQQSTFSQSCCSPSATQKFGLLAMNTSLAAAHESPLPFIYEAANGSMITYKCPDGTIAGAFEVKAVKANNNWLIVIHEWWGLNDYIKREAEKLQIDLVNTNVLAIDLYDGKIAETPGVAQDHSRSFKLRRCQSKSVHTGLVHGRRLVDANSFDGRKSIGCLCTVLRNAGN